MGESPEACARRELEEETGIQPARIGRLTTIFTTPGFTDEIIHLFFAHGLTEGTARREVDEFMELHPLPWSEVMGMLRSGTIQDAKTSTSLMFVQCFVRNR